MPPPELVFSAADGRSHRLMAPTVRGRNVVKLSQIASVKIGLQSGDNSKFYRATAGIKGGAAKGGYNIVDERNVLTDEDLANLTSEQKLHGIRINDRESDRYFVPLDKAGKADIDGGLLSMFWRPVDFYVDWSERAVTEMKNHPKGVFRNQQFYFGRGVSFSNTGIYPNFSPWSRRRVRPKRLLHIY